YLKVVGLLTEILDQPAALENLFEIRATGLRMTLIRGQETPVTFTREGRQVKALYNPSYSGDSFLVAQRPDVVVEIEDPDWPMLTLVVDAKYQVDASAGYADRYLSPGPPEDSLNVIHRYRDALIELQRSSGTLKRTVIQGAILFPYRETGQNNFGQSRLWLALGRLGIGAIPLLPAGDRYLRQWLEGL